MSVSATVAEVRLEIISAIQKLSNRCLYQAAKWAGEALNGLSSDHDTSGDKTLHESSAPVQVYLPEIPNDKFVFAKTLFDAHEYDRCAFVLTEAAKSDGMCLFLRLYAKYISGEMSKESEQGSILGPKDTAVPNAEIVEIVRELREFKDLDDDPFLLYLYGVVLRHQKSEQEALKALSRSVILFPYNWSAWQELLACINSADELLQYYDDELSLVLDGTLMSKIFMAYALQEFFQYNEEILNSLNTIKQEYLPGFLFLDVQKALINYHGLNYDKSEKLFDSVILRDPYRIDDLDTYSNILYVMERSVKIAYLAQLTTRVDKFRPETCCIVANYYSLRSDHEKAIVNFQRALNLNRNCLSAWTLMGHEFVELKNTHAAIESYRRAVDSNKKDFRAWYGLGQAYEVLEMHYYSLYYYERAVALKPLDVRMWVALASSYEKLDRTEEAIKGFRRALNVGDSDPAILYRIALLHEKRADIKMAVSYMKLCLAEESNIDTVTDSGADSITQACMWMAKYELKRSNWRDAHFYAEKVTSGTAVEVEEARNIMKEAKIQLQAART